MQSFKEFYKEYLLKNEYEGHNIEKHTYISEEIKMPNRKICAITEKK